MDLRRSISIPRLPHALPRRMPSTRCTQHRVNTPACLGRHILSTWASPTRSGTSNIVIPRQAPSGSPLLNFDRVAFEADMLTTERALGCDTATGLAPCHNPPPGAIFYPIFSTVPSGTACLWQEGGPSIPGTTNNFGGSSATEFSTTPEPAVYINGTSAAPGSVTKFENYRRILSTNPCTW